MILVLDAMLAVSALVLMFAAPWALNWIIGTFKENALLRKGLQVLGALVVLVPAVSLAVSQVQQRSANLSPELAQQLGIGAAVAWGAVCLLLPAVVLSCGEWDRSNKEVFRLVVGFCLCVNVSLLCWALVNEMSRVTRQAEAVVMVGPLRWAAPVALFALVLFDYFMLKLSHKVYPKDEQIPPALSQPPVAPHVLSPEPAAPPVRKPRNRKTKPHNGPANLNENSDIPPSSG